MKIDQLSMEQTFLMIMPLRPSLALPLKEASWLCKK